MGKPGLAAVVLGGLILLGCAGPETRRPEVSKEVAEAEARKEREIVLRAQLEDQWRLYDIASRVEAGGAGLCKDRVRGSLGFMTANRDAFAEAMRPAARAVLGLGPRLQIVHVTEGSPAAAAGLLPGDILVSVNDKALPEGAGAEKAAAEQMTPLLKGDRRPIRIVVLRNSQEMPIAIMPQTVCDYRYVLDSGDAINAFTDGSVIHMTKGMMRFAKDDELALVLSHELAHNVMGHVDKKTQNATVAGLGGLALDILAAAGGVSTGGAFSKSASEAGAMAYSQDFEAEADYVGLYILARAGYPIDDAPNFWRRMATVNPSAISLARTHPTTPFRFVQLEKTVVEIKAKEAQGIELRPELGSAAESATPAAATEAAANQRK